MSSMIISTGGTGHVIPAKVFYDYFKEKFNVKIISDKRGLNFIEKKNYNVNEVAIHLGYSTSSHFISAFKNKFGTTPKKFIASN